MSDIPIPSIPSKPEFDAGLYAAANRTKVLDRLADQSGFVLLVGGETVNRKWTDTEVKFRQESNFFYMTGVQDPGYSLVIDLKTKQSTLYMPAFGADFALWHGAPYHVDQVCSQNDLPVFILAQTAPIHILHTSECLSPTAITEHLRTAITEARVLKSELEIQIMEYAAIVTGHAHVALMKAAKPGMSERHLQGLFEFESMKYDCIHQAYLPIVAAGNRGAVLHYGQNDGVVPQNGNELLLVDAGCEFLNYASDVTRTYPTSGTYTGDFKTIYEIVLEAQMAVLSAMKDGVEYEDLHRLSHTFILQGLVKAQIVNGPLDELVKHHISALFFPHGLGHLIGIDVHDVGGYPEGVERINEPGIKYLRLRRVLKESMVVTVEPGLYFVDAILDPAVADPVLSKYLNLPVLERFRANVGGVRIEDDVVILKDGIKNLTGWIPKHVDQIEAIGTWKHKIQ